MSKKIIYFKGIKFYNYSFDYLIKKLNKGGVLVAPAASALTQINKNKNYHSSLKSSDIAIFDSGLFCILLRIFLKKKVKKLSGYFFLKKFLEYKQSKNKNILLINPTKLDGEINKNLLLKKNFKKVSCYTAPIFKKKIVDKKLLKIIKKKKYDYIIINIGGIIQEQLGLFIKNNIKKKISIICTGAAIAFITKRQAPINDYVDKLYLGWFWRVIYNPKMFFLRTLKSLLLIKLFININ